MDQFYDSLDVFDQLRSMEINDPEIQFFRHRLQFRYPAKTSRGTLLHRDVWYLKLYSAENPNCFGLGEAAPLPGLSRESADETEDALRLLTADPAGWNNYIMDYQQLPASVYFALEQALLDLYRGGNRRLFPSKFTDGRDVIRINGLIWMNQPDEMLRQVEEKLQEGYSCIKLKIGALDWKSEFRIIEIIRNAFPQELVEIRLDANGAYSPRLAMEVLDTLEPMGIHSVEQPIAPGRRCDLAEICMNSPVPVALDEELIGIRDSDEMEELLDEIMPHYIIIKPSLLGGFQTSEQWIHHADERNLGWWVTSYLESNVGLNAIAQWAYTLQNPIHQGLGTGKLFTNNVNSPLVTEGELLSIDKSKSWKLPFV